MDPPATILPGQVAFRLLCHTATAGGVIGHSGTVIKRLENDTGARIRLENTVPNCHERVINVIGSSAMVRRIEIEGLGEMREVSQAQEALVRVFERVLEVEGTQEVEAVVGCRLLGGQGEIGAIMGRKGNVVDMIRKISGAQVRVLPRELLPACAFPTDELIQVMGGTVAVKKALLAIAQRLQFRSQMEKAEFLPQHNLSLPTLAGNSVDYSPFPIVHPLSPNTDKMVKLEEKSSRQKVVFRLLCAICTAGGVIGKGASYVKALERETGASIKLAASVAWAKERVATISALENPGPLYSPAQIATIRVFDRSIDIGVEMGVVLGTGKGDTVSARLLVTLKEVACLVDDGGKVASDISSVSVVKMQLLAGDHALHCSAEFDKVLKITGAYENVKSALYQVTDRLRDNMFSGIKPHVASSMHFPHSSLNISPYECEEITSPSEKVMTLTRELDQLGFSDKDESHYSPGLPHLQISGATIIVQDPCPGKGHGKVIVSRSLNQIEVAKSLLHAFVLPHP
ncbi:hypothetical protein LguiA_005388 [Lonicera macranthoides]